MSEPRPFVRRVRFVERRTHELAWLTYGLAVLVVAIVAIVRCAG